MKANSQKMIPMNVKYSKLEGFFVVRSANAVAGRSWRENQKLTKARGLLSLGLDQR